MRHPLVPALAVVLLLGVYAVGGAALAAGAGPGDEVTVDGTVTGTEGAPASGAVVLIGEYGTLTKLSPDELRDVAADNQDLTVVEVGDDGRFEASVAWERADAAVALSDAGVSEVARLGNQNATLELQLHERRPQTIHAHAGAVSADERQVQLYVSLVNNGDAAVENLSVAVASLPDGWSVAEVETGGTYRPDDGTLTWSSVPPGGEVDTTVVLAVPEDAPVSEYPVELHAESATHPVSVAPATFEVLPEDTPGPTKTSLPGGDEGTPTTSGDEETLTDRAADTTSPSPTATSAPGFTVGAAVAAVALLAASLRRRR